MKYIVSLVEISAKRSFKILKNNDPIWCSCIKNNVKITKIFFQHICGAFKRRKIRETIKRLLIIPFIDQILFEGNITEIRINNKKKYYKISLTISSYIFSIVLLYMKNEYKLISCFIDSKKDPSQALMPRHVP